MAKKMIQSLKGYKLLEGYRGSPPADVDSLCFILKRISDLLVNFPAISEIDLNPVKVFDQGMGSCVIDCKIYLNDENKEKISLQTSDINPVK